MTEENVASEVHILTSISQHEAALRNLVKGRHVVELGAGTGVLTRLLLAAGAAKVSAYEIDESLLNAGGLLTFDNPRLHLFACDYTKVNFTDKRFAGACLVSNPAYSTLPFVRTLPFRDMLLMVPGSQLASFEAEGYELRFALNGEDFSPPARGDHAVVQRGFENALFSDLHALCARLRSGDVLADRVEELSKIAPSASLTAFGGFPIVEAGPQGGYTWCENPINAAAIADYVRMALGHSALLTYTNKRAHSLDALGKICIQRQETWAYHWLMMTFLVTGPAAVQLAIARDARFRLGWPVGNSPRLLSVFTASGSIDDWLKFSKHLRDGSFDPAVRDVMADIGNILKKVLP